MGQTDVDKLTVLVVDDEEDLVHLYKEVLEMIPNLNIFTEVDPQAALEFIRKNEVHILITDCNMPLVSGKELAKTGFDLHKTKVIMITGELDIELPEGVWSLHKKPFNVFEIIRDVEVAISLRKI